MAWKRQLLEAMVAGNEAELRSLLRKHNASLAPKLLAEFGDQSATESLLRHVSAWGYLELAQILIDAGADVDSRTQNHMAALLQAVHFD